MFLPSLTLHPQFAQITESIEALRATQVASGIASEGVVWGADGEGVCRGTGGVKIDQNDP